MKILLINHYAGSASHGMEYRPYYLAKEWAKLGHEVFILAASHAHVRSVQPSVSSDFQEEMMDGIHYLWVKAPSYQGNGLQRILNILVFILKLLWHAASLAKKIKPDAVIASSTYPFDIYAAARIARMASAKLIFEVHDLWPLSPVELGGYSPKHPFIRMAQHAEDCAYRKADIVVSMLPATLPYMRSRGLDENKWFYIPNGVLIEEWDQPQPLNENTAAEMARIRQKYRFVLGYTGAHGVANALTSLVMAASHEEMKDVAFVLVGKGPEKSRLQQQVKDASISNVFFLDPVGKAEVPALLTSMDVLYIGLQNQSLFRFGISPNKLFDYMMAGKPVIQAINSGRDLVAESGCGISIPPEDAGSLVQAILSILGMSQERMHTMGEKGKAYVMAHHDYRILANQFLSIMHPEG